MVDTGAGGDEVIHDAPGFIRVYKSGRVERFLRIDFAPPCTDAATGVSAKDITILPGAGVSARIYLPPAPAGGEQGKLPVLVFFHGGAFCLGSAFDAAAHGHANQLAARASAIVVSVEYRLAPEHPVPACYDDAWAALRWAAEGADPWLRDRGDRGRMFVVGYSTGGNVAHNVALRAGSEADALPRGARVRGLGLLHPYFLSAKKADGEHSWLRGKLEELWPFACGGRTAGLDDPRVNPVAGGAPSLRRLGCDRVLVCLAEDELRLRGKAYHDGLLRSGWAEGDTDLLDSVGEDHQFFLREPPSANALVLMDRLVALLGAGAGASQQ